MRLVVDANVIVALVLARPESDPLKGHLAVAPYLLASEATNALSEMAFRGAIPAEAALSAIDRLADLSIEYQRPARRHPTAAAIARSLGWGEDLRRRVCRARGVARPAAPHARRTAAPARRRPDPRARALGPVAEFAGDQYPSGPAAAPSMGEPSGARGRMGA